MALAAVLSKAVVLLLLTCCLLFVTLIVGVRNCSMFCCTLCYAHSSFAIILMGKRERELVIVVWLFIAVSWGCLQCVIVVFPDYTHLLLLIGNIVVSVRSPVTKTR